MPSRCKAWGVRNLNRSDILVSRLIVLYQGRTGSGLCFLFSIEEQRRKPTNFRAMEEERETAGSRRHTTPFGRGGLMG